MSRWLLSVPTSFGVESLAAHEIRMLGYETERVEDGRISFYGDDRAICRANLWLRTAERVQIKVGDFAAASFVELFDQVKALPWPDYLPADAQFPVSGHCLSSKLGSVPDCQSIIKKAVVESMKGKWKTEWFKETGPMYRINFNIIRDRTTIYIDTSGDGLHKRGYRESPAPTPIRETLAAALVELSRWRPGMALWDPFCGSGTIAIEAAMMAARRAPGLQRGFAAESWTTAPFKSLFNEERAKARAVHENAMSEHASRGVMPGAATGALTGASVDALAGDSVGATVGAAPGITGRPAVHIVGSDLSRQCVRAARQNAAKAGVSDLVRFFQMDARDMGQDHGRLGEMGVGFPERGCVVSNPPYGERHDDAREALEACREWAPALEGFQGWNFCIISAIDDFERMIGRRASKRRKLHNGKIKCQAYMFFF